MILEPATDIYGFEPETGPARSGEFSLALSVLMAAIASLLFNNLRRGLP